jgi:hypothetical protein
VNTFTGTFTLTFDGQTTSALDHDASGSAVDAALEALSNIGSGDVSVIRSGSGVPSDPYEYTIEFTGSLALTDVPELTSNASGLYNGATISTTQEPVSTRRWATQRRPAFIHIRPGAGCTARLHRAALPRTFSLHAHNLGDTPGAGQN